MVSEPEDMVVMRFYCHLLGLGNSLFPFPISQVPGPRSQVPSPSPSPSRLTILIACLYPFLHEDLRLAKLIPKIPINSIFI